MIFISCHLAFAFSVEMCYYVLMIVEYDEGWIMARKFYGQSQQFSNSDFDVEEQPSQSKSTSSVREPDSIDEMGSAQSMPRRITAPQNNASVSRMDIDDAKAASRGPSGIDSPHVSGQDMSPENAAVDAIQAVKGASAAAGAATGATGMAAMAFSRVVTPVVNVVAKIATTLGVSKGAAGLMSFVLVLLASATGVFVYSNVSHDDAMTTIFVGDDECVNYLAEVDAEGENEIPETWEWWPAGGEPGAHGKKAIPLETTMSLEWGGNPTAGEFNRYLGDMTCMAANEFLLSYINKGDFKTVNGVTQVGKWFPMAINPSCFGAVEGESAKVGDWITIYFDNGQSAEILMFDAKGDDHGNCEINGTYDYRDKESANFHRISYATDNAFGMSRPYAICPWGHIVSRDNPEQINVWETLWHDGSSSTIGALVGDAEAKPVSFTNHGPAPEYAAFEHLDSSSVIGGATSSKSSIRNSKAASAVEECQAKPNYDNSTLAAAAVSFSYSRRVTFGEGYPGTKLYETVCEAVMPGDGTASYGYRSCDRAMAAALRWTGADIDACPGHVGSQAAYYRDHPEKYEIIFGKVVGDGDVVDGYVPGGGAEAITKAEENGIQPGDIFVNNSHTFMYVGPDVVEQVYNSALASSSDANLGQPDPNSAWVHASNGDAEGVPLVGRAACVQDYGADSGCLVVRYKGDYPDKDKYADVGQMATVGGVSVKGTACDCVQTEEEEDCGERIAKASLDIAITAHNDAKVATYREHAAADTSGLGIYFDDALGAYSSSNPATETTPLPEDIFPEAAKYNRWQKNLPDDCPGKGEYTCCSTWPATIMYMLDIDKNFSTYSVEMDDYARSRPDLYTVMQMSGTGGSGDDPWADQCKPGDILVIDHGTGHGHVMMYVGNELAQQYFPGTDGYMLEAGLALGCDGWYLAVTDATYWNPSSRWTIIRTKCPDEEEGVSGMLSDGPISARQKAVIDAAKSTPSPGGGLCAWWVEDVFSNAGIGNWGGNACDLYYAYCKSSDKSQLKPGMIVAVSTYPTDGLGATYGHVGIYIGNGMVRENIGYIQETPIDTWIESYGGSVTPKWGWMGGVSLA